jgi:hypothetical protein
VEAGATPQGPDLDLVTQASQALLEAGEGDEGAASLAGVEGR